MSYWSNNPELYDEIIFREMVSRGLVSKGEDPSEAVQYLINEVPQYWKVMERAEQDYWADLTDETYERETSRRLSEGKTAEGDTNDQL